MMRLSLMRRFFDTMDENQQSGIVDQLVLRWLTGVAEVECVRASANFVFQVRTTDKGYFLRFNHQSERETQTIESELRFIYHLSHRGIRAANPIPSLSGRHVETGSTELGLFHAVLFETMEGEHWGFDHLDAERFELWGKALGKMHAASRGYQAAQRPSWTDHLLFAEQSIPAHEEHACTELQVVRTMLHGLRSDVGEYGLIHFDFELDNLMWRDHEAGIVDFDDCAFYWFEADIAFALRDLFEDSIQKIDFGSTQLCAFLAGYRSRMPLSQAAIKRIPLFLRMHNLVTFAKLLRAIGTGSDLREPRWMMILRSRLMNKCSAYWDQFRNCPINLFVD